MLKRTLLVSLLAGLALGAQSAIATDLWYYEGHGWLPQPPFSAEGRQGTIIAGGKSSPYPEYATQGERPPFEVPDRGRPVTVFFTGASTLIAGPVSAASGSLESESMTLRSVGSPRIAAPAPYDTPGGYFE